MTKFTLVLTLVLAWACIFNTAANEDEQTDVETREKRQIGGFNPFQFGQQLGNGFGFNPFAGRPPAAQIGGNPGGLPLNAQGRPINCNNRRNRQRPECNPQVTAPQNAPLIAQGNQINCDRRRNRNRPECQNQRPPTGPQTSSGGNPLALIPWLSQLTPDGQSLRIPNLPKTPTSQSRFFLLGTGRPDQAYQQCLTPKLEPGHCRYLQHCILPEFTNSFNNFLRYVCFIEGRYVGVCCPDNINTNGITQAPPPAPTPPPTPRPTTPPTEARGCGLIAKRPPTRIVGGKPADPQEWPWMAALLRDGSNQYCGGTLITDRHVLTAAHCVDGFDQSTIKVRLGEYTFNQQTDSVHRDFSAAAIRMHQSYDRTTYVNDIAIIALGQSTEFTPDIWPVCLPEGDEAYDGRTATVTGWGTIYYGGPVATTLQEVTVPVWTNTDCDNAYEQNIIESQLCAGVREGGKDSCQGDSGGPLLLQQGSENRWAVIGVVSWGIRCAEPNNPGVYTRVSKYRDWIRSNAI